MDNSNVLSLYPNTIENLIKIYHCNLYLGLFQSSFSCHEVVYLPMKLWDLRFPTPQICAVLFRAQRLL
jgi:hypothetical protein